MGDITLEKDGHILLIGLNRPKKYNAMTLAMFGEIASAYGQLERDPELRCGLMFAHGDHFTAGLQLDDWGTVFSSGQSFPLREGQIDPFGVASPRVSKPVVFAVKGICFTAGVEMMLNSDVRIAANNTRFAQLEVKRGIYACGGATIRLVHEMGWANAQRYLLTGDEWSAADAYRMGLVQQLTEPGEEFGVALEIARRITRAAPLGVQGSLKSSIVARQKGEMAALECLFPDLKPVMASDDVKEGLQSYLERREAVFKGR
jgi:enoyl-CoA hydratase